MGSNARSSPLTVSSTSDSAIELAVNSNLADQAIQSLASTVYGFAANRAGGVQVTGLFGSEATGGNQIVSAPCRIHVPYVLSVWFFDNLGLCQTPPERDVRCLDDFKAEDDEDAMSTKVPVPGFCCRLRHPISHTSFCCFLFVEQSRRLKKTKMAKLSPPWTLKTAPIETMKSPNYLNARKKFNRSAMRNRLHPLRKEMYLPVAAMKLRTWTELPEEFYGQWIKKSNSCDCTAVSCRPGPGSFA